MSRVRAIGHPSYPSTRAFASGTNPARGQSAGQAARVPPAALQARRCARAPARPLRYVRLWAVASGSGEKSSVYLLLQELNLDAAAGGAGVLLCRHVTKQLAPQAPGVFVFVRVKLLCWAFELMTPIACGTIIIQAIFGLICLSLLLLRNYYYHSFQSNPKKKITVRHRVPGLDLGPWALRAAK